MNDDQILLLTREITGIGTKQDTMMEMMREMKVEMASKAEMKAMKEAHEREMKLMKDAFDREMETLRKENGDLREDLDEHIKSHAEAPYKKWMVLASCLSGLSGVAAILAIIQHH